MVAGYGFNPLARLRAGRLFTHLIILFFILVAAFPVLLIFINALKSRRAIFEAPLALPNGETFSWVGFETVFSRSNFPLYYLNSVIVVMVAIAFVLFFGAMAAWALSEYDFKGNKQMALYLAIGIMIPIRIGTVSILRLMVRLGLVNTLWSLIFVYTAQGLALTIFILSQFMAQVPRDLKDAARVDGASEYRIFGMVLPMVRPALATVAVFTMIPIWNDLWFPLILAPSDRTKTVILGAQEFLGQFVSDWNAVLAALSLAILPVLILYLIFSQQLIAGLTRGSVKQ
ncbi:MAG: carbohydrate ABC transporter permease [Alkalispirochaetaceae bacterium]